MCAVGVEMMCECEFDPYPADAEIAGLKSCHFRRICLFCGYVWFGLHCPHDGYQNMCPKCGKYPAVVADREP